MILISHPPRVCESNTPTVLGETSANIDDDSEWPNPIEEHFIQLLHEQVKNGNQLSNADEIENWWVKIDNSLHDKFGKRYTIMGLKSKYKSLYQLHSDFAKLLAHTGMGWDPITNTVTACSDNIWKYYLKENPSAKYFHKKGCNHYHVLCEIFGNTSTTSQSSTNLDINRGSVQINNSNLPGERHSNLDPSVALISTSALDLSKLDDVLGAWTKYATAKIEASLAEVDSLKNQLASCSLQELAPIEECLHIFVHVKSLSARIGGEYLSRCLMQERDFG
ncbi:hypothetical protein MKX03_010778 [Papaver bracteatum]|nr:hypothetical protein MKX03_010778 [Papaver bracteatum]